MERPNTISGLRAKRKELKRQITTLIKQVRVLDEAISIFEQGVTRRKPRGAVTERHRFMMTYLKDASGPVSVPEVVASWVDHKGLILTPESRNELRRRVRNSFYKLKKSGRLEIVGTINRRNVWQMKLPSAGLDCQ